MKKKGSSKIRVGGAVTGKQELTDEYFGKDTASSRTKDFRIDSKKSRTEDGLKGVEGSKNVTKSHEIVEEKADVMIMKKHQLGDKISLDQARNC